VTDRASIAMMPRYRFTNINIIIGRVVSQSIRYIASWMRELRRNLRIKKPNLGKPNATDFQYLSTLPVGSSGVLDNPAPIAQRFDQSLRVEPGPF
jgi:hypothetical protein